MKISLGKEWRNPGLIALHCHFSVLVYWFCRPLYEYIPRIIDLWLLLLFSNCTLYQNVKIECSSVPIKFELIQFKNELYWTVNFYHVIHASLFGFGMIPKSMLLCTYHWEKINYIYNTNLVWLYYCDHVCKKFVLDYKL